MRKGTKEYVNALKSFLGPSWRDEKCLPQSSNGRAFVSIDIMAYVHRMRSLGSSTYFDFATQYLKHLVNLPYDLINVVADRYDFAGTESLKIDERSRRKQDSQNK